MKDFIKNQITNEIYTKIVELETERNKEKQKIIAQEIINALNIEDYTAYMAYDDEGDIFIALNYYYSSNEIDNSLFTFKNGYEFIDFIEQNKQIPIGIIFIDLNTPKLNGIEFLRHAIQSEGMKVLPMIIISTSREENDVRNSYINGARGYIDKAVDGESYRKSIELCFKYWDTQILPE